MTYAQIQKDLEKLKEDLGTDSLELPFYSYVRLNRSHLKIGQRGSAELALLDRLETADFPNKTLKIEFETPVYIAKINLGLKPTFLNTKRITISYYGCDPSLRPHELKKTISTAGESELKINSTNTALEISSNKPISDCISEINIEGDANFDPKSFQDVLIEKMEVVNEAFESLDTCIGGAQALVSKGAELEQSIVLLNDKKHSSELENAKLAGENAQLTSSRDELQLEVGSLQNRLKEDRSAELALKSSISHVQSEIKDAAATLIRTKRDLDDVMNQKAFYNVTLGGYKKETQKNFYINLVIIFVLVILCGYLVYQTIQFYEHSLSQILTTNDDKKLFAIVSFRLAAGGILLTIFYWMFDLIKLSFKNTYRLITDTRNIEAKLILAKNTAETVLKGQVESEKRNYASFLSFVVLKNHFMNMSEESIAHDLEIDPEVLSKVMPLMPQKFDVVGTIERLVKAVRGQNSSS